MVPVECAPVLRLSAIELPALAAIIQERARQLSRPCVVALDGHSGSGKSTLAARLAVDLGAVVLEGDDFFAGGVELRSDSASVRARDCIDWRTQRAVLATLRAGRTASYFAFDWAAFDGRRLAPLSLIEPRGIVLLEGVYSARPELRDLTDLRVLLDVSETTRSARLLAREGEIGAWERQWHEAEQWYFATAAPASTFDVVLHE